MDPVGFRSLLAEADTYVAFFRRRAEIEDSYADLLSKLGQEATVDGHLVTLKSAWSTLRREVSREAESRRQYATALRMLVQDPLSSFRDSKARVRKRIKDELKSSANDHIEYRATVARLQKEYERKCEQVRSLQSHDAQINSLISTSASSSPPETVMSPTRAVAPLPPDASPPTSPDHPGAAASTSPPTAAAAAATSAHLHPQPIVAGAISLSNSLQPPAALHPPGVTTAAARAQDAFKASKTQLNSLIQRMGGEVPVGRTDATSIRATKLRREAEEADNQYRRSVFHLETLRLRRERVQQASLISAEEFAVDLSSYMRNMLRTLVDLTIEINGESTTGCDLLMEKAMEISADVDVTQFAQRLPAEPQAESPVLYNNCYVGLCKSLQFGVVSLTDHASSHNGQLVPLVVLKSIAEIEARGLDHEGIYRVSGRTSAITDAVLQIERDEDAFAFVPAQHGSDTVAGVLKLYLRQLPTPLFPMAAADRVAATRLAETDLNEVFLMLSKRLRRLAPAHQATLKVLCEHLARVADHEEKNRMSLNNLGLVFAPVVFGEDDPAALAAAASGAGQHSIARDRCMELLIAHHSTLFESLPVLQEPLPDSRARGRATSDASGHLSDEEFPIRRPSIGGHPATTRSSIRRARSPLVRARVAGETPRSPSPRASLDFTHPPSSSPPAHHTASGGRASSSPPPAHPPPATGNLPVASAVNGATFVSPISASPVRSPPFAEASADPYDTYEAHHPPIALVSAPQPQQPPHQQDTPPPVLKPSPMRRLSSGGLLPPGAAPPFQRDVKQQQHQHQQQKSNST